MHTLRSVVYVSTAVRPLSEAELESLLVESRNFNLESQVSGVLLYGGGNFMQCFEGTEASMHATYERIRASKRHTGIIELLNESVPKRSFEAWLMGFRQASRAQLLSLHTAQWRRDIAAGPGAREEPAGLSLLKHFWHQQK